MKPGCILWEMISYLTFSFVLGVGGYSMHTVGALVFVLDGRSGQAKASSLPWHLSMYHLHMFFEGYPLVSSQQYRRKSRLAGFSDGIILLLVQIMVGGRPGVEIPR